MIRSSGVQREQATTRGLLRTMSLLRPLMAGVLLLSVSSKALGPPNGTVGTLDFRYPDRIVEPLVRCPFEGYFPHPRDNTRFYRCYKRYGSSFFWRAYFQCQPCTVFSDALDQCVYQETGTLCLPPADRCPEKIEDCRLVKICPAANSNRAAFLVTDVCFKTTSQCPGEPEKPLCQDGYAYDKTDHQCRVGTPNSECLPDANLTPKPYTTYVPTLPPRTATLESASPSTKTSLDPTSRPTTTTIAPIPQPTDVNDYIDNVFVCELAGSRPNAEGYRSLGCSEKQFCDYNGRPLAPITGCQFYLECDFTAPGVLQLVHRQCPTGQFFFYGNINQCGGQGQHSCLSSTTSSNAMRQTPDLFTPDVFVRLNQVNPSQSAIQLPYTQVLAAASLQHPTRSLPHNNIGLKFESPSSSDHPGPFRHDVLRPALFWPDYHKSFGQVNTVGRITSHSAK